MSAGIISVLCLTLAVHATAVAFSRNGRFIPNIKVAEEIDVSDVTFTTPPSSDSDLLASIASPHVRTSHGKPRMVIPVVTYHKVHHPPPGELQRAHGPLPASGFLKPKKIKFGGKTAVALAFPTNHRIVGPKRVVVPIKYKHKVEDNGPGPRPVYYLVGDEHSAPTTNNDDDYESADYGTESPQTPGKFDDGIRLYDERELQFVKESKKNRYPKKYSTQVLKKSNHKTKSGHREDEDRETSEHGDDPQETGHRSESTDPRFNPHGGRGDRVEFQMYGMDGPNSYKFGYDTGKGDNRHFRFEERDNEGRIRGHYGYMDNDGKMRIMKYEADPETGFHAGPVDYSPEETN